MTDQTKNVLRKLHLSLFRLSLGFAAIITLAVIVSQIHDAIAVRNAELCNKSAYLEAWFKYNGERSKYGSDEAVIAIIDATETTEAGKPVFKACMSLDFGSKRAKVWFGDGDLFRPFLSEQILIIYGWLVTLWLIPALLIGLRRWLKWIVESV